ncbi:MAG: hypothetical protein ACE5GB_07595 [Acidimicrobiales bacterium]
MSHPPLDGRLRLEVTIEPFVEGEPGPHAVAPAEIAAAAGLAVDFGPFGTCVSGPAQDVLAVLVELVSHPLAAGASRLTLQVEHDEEA